MDIQDKIRDINLEEMIVRANTGVPISDQERSLIGYYITNREDLLTSRMIDQDDLFLAVTLVGRAQFLELEDELKTIASSSDVLLASHAIEILGSWWKKGEANLELIFDLSLGKAYDRDGDLQSVSIRVLSEIIKDAHKENRNFKHIKDHLISICNDSDQPNRIRSFAYFSLCEALLEEEASKISPHENINFEAKSVASNLVALRSL